MGAKKEKIKVPDRYGFWRCDGKEKGEWIHGPMHMHLNTLYKRADCPYKDKCWRTKDIETKWNTYSKVCGEWNDYHWFWGDVQEIER